MPSIITVVAAAAAAAAVAIVVAIVIAGKSNSQNYQAADHANLTFFSWTSEL